MRPDYDERSLGELFAELTRETRTLITQEVALARKELSQKASEMGKGAGIAAVGGFLAYAGLLAVIAGLVLLLAKWIPAWISALIVGLIVIGIGYAVLQSGLSKLKAENLKPKKTLASLKENKEWVQDQVS